MSKLLVAAKFYQSLGWHLIPIKTDGNKKPPILWDVYKTRQATDEELEEWFEKQKYNMGVICGQSGFAVIDDDSYKAQGGQIKLASTLFQTTPRGGTHFLFKCPKGLRPSVNAELAVDIRAFDSYILVAPSSNNGIPYKWNVKSKEEFTESLNNLPDLPLAYLEKIQPKRDISLNGSEYDINSAFGASIGERNDKLKSAIVSFINKNDPETAWRLTVALNSTYKPPVEPDELQKKFNYIYEFVQKNPPIKPGKQPEPITQNIVVSRENRLEKVKQIFKEGYKEGIRTGFPSLDKIIHGLQSGQTYLIFADTNVGKSVFALNILIVISKQGIPVCYFDLENSADLTHERMILINDPVLTKPKFDELLKEKKLDKYIDDVKTLGIDSWSLDEINDRFGIISFEAIEAIIKEDIKKGTKIFCIDHLHYFDPSETDYAKLADIARKLNTLAAREHLIILFVAHTKKGMSFEKDGKIQVKRPTIEDVSGSKFIVSHTKNVISLTRNEQSDDPLERMRTMVYVNKQKTGPTGKFNLVFNPEKLTFKDYAAYSAETSLSLISKDEEVESEENGKDYIGQLKMRHEKEKELKKLDEWNRRAKQSKEDQNEP